MEHRNRRVSLTVKTYILIISIVLTLSLVLTITGYHVHCEKVDSYNYAQTERAAKATTRIPGDYVENLWKYVNTDEFRQVREEALLADDESIIENWMKGKPDAYVDIRQENIQSDDESLNLYYDYLSLLAICEDAISLFEVDDVYVQYEEDGVTYNLIDPNESLFHIGTIEDPLEEFASYGDNERIPATVYKSKYGWLCTACEPIKTLGEERVAGLSCADIDMNDIMWERRGYLRNCAIFIVFELIAVLIIGIYLMRRTVTKPIRLLTDAAKGFASSEAGYTKEDVIRLPINSNDEIGDLYKEIQSMQGRIVDFTDNITRITTERERVNTELRMAAGIQSSMLPNSLPDSGERDEYDLYASMDPAKEVGGDFYDYFLIDQDHLCLVIADVSDKGVPAALFMMASKILINYRAREGGTPAEILTAVNAELIRNNKTKMFVTVWMAILDLNSGKMICCNAGHENPVFRGKDGVFRFFEDKHGFMVGAIKKAKYTDYEITLAPGDAVFVYTDGLPEACNEEGEPYGNERMEAVLNMGEKASSQTILQNVKKDLSLFVNSARQFDDVTMLCLEYFGPEKPETER